MKIQNTKTRFSQNRSPVTYGVFAYDGSLRVYNVDNFIIYYLTRFIVNPPPSHIIQFILVVFYLKIQYFSLSNYVKWLSLVCDIVMGNTFNNLKFYFIMLLSCWYVDS